MQWVEDLPVGDTLFFCRATQQSYLRLLTVKEWMKEDVCTNSEALDAFEKLISDSRIDFAQEPQDLEARWTAYARVSTPSPKRWMDAYLAAFARQARMSFVTFDRGFGVFEGLDLIAL
jgi:toxin-antitoxin system PIN domain toxin